LFGHPVQASCSSSKQAPRTSSAPNARLQKYRNSASSVRPGISSPPG
jgi:hypothetical protein